MGDSRQRMAIIHQIILLPVIGWRVFPNVEAWMWETATSLRKIIVCLTIEKETRNLVAEIGPFEILAACTGDGWVNSN